MRILLAPLLAAALLAGCAATVLPPPQAGAVGPCAVESNPTPGAVGGPDSLACALATAPHVDARATLDALKAFSSGYPYRQSGTPTHLAARDDLAGRFAAAGLEVIRQPFGSGSPGGAADYQGENILGVKWGADRSSWVVVGAHYDVTEGAVYGTYDDGSGTAMVFQLAAAFAHVNTTRTLVFAEFDQEELGLVGSAHFLRQAETGALGNVTLAGMVDLDMVGITYPHPAKLITWENSDTLVGWIQEGANATGFPTQHLSFRTPFGGSSDGATFIKAGIPTAYFWSDWDEYYLPDGTLLPDTPVPYVGPYPWWHKMDTYETMMVSAGGEANLEAGFQHVLDIVSPLLVRMSAGDLTTRA